MARTNASRSTNPLADTDAIPDHISKPSWIYRRTTVFTCLVFDAILLASIVWGWYKGLADNTAIEILAGGLITQSTAVIGSYVFGATFESINVMKMFSSIRNGAGESFGRDGT